MGLKFELEVNSNDNSFSPIDVLDYVYAILYSPSYREKYRDFLKTAFPKIPIPNNKNTFRKLAKFGKRLREIHLLEHTISESLITQFAIKGNNIVGKVIFENNNVYINEVQYFKNVPTDVWEFYIGGYQPAQKWLKDRKGDALSYDDIIQYQRMIVALHETIKIMNELQKIELK